MTSAGPPWAKTDTARDFYERCGFEPMLDSPRHLYLPLTTARQALRL